MKKIFAILSMCFLVGVVTISAKETNIKSQTETNGKRYKVVVTYTVSYTYKDADTYEVIIEGAKSSRKTEEFIVYAETEDEAEEEAKNQCYLVCSNQGRYVGETTYKGKKCKLYEYRRIENARAQ